MDVIHRRCAGLDVHKKSVMACVRILQEGGTRATKRVREFGTMTADLERLAEWLTAQGVTHVAMESTGVYWKPIFNVLEGRFELLLCNAQHIKQVPGRKTDVKDCEWIAQLLQHGLLRGSFVPSQQGRELRDLTRHRTKLADQRTSVVNRLHKVLEDANVKLGAVATDVLGKSGRAIIEALLGGHEDPEHLANLARGRLRGKIPELRRALEGRISEHHRFMLGLLYRQIETLDEFIAEVDEQVAQLTGFRERPDAVEQDSTLPLFPAGEDGPDDVPPPPDGGEAAEPSPPEGAPPPSSLPADTGPSEACATPLSFAWAIGLLTTIPGVQRRIAESVVAEIGADMSQFPTPGHLASWAGLCPGNNRSAGKSKSSRTTQGNRWLSRVMVQAAWAASRTKGTYYSAQFKRIARRRGSKRAAVAVAHSMLVAVHYMLSTDSAHQDLGDSHFDRLQPQRAARYHTARLERLGYKVTVERDRSNDEKPAA